MFLLEEYLISLPESDAKHLGETMVLLVLCCHQGIYLQPGTYGHK